MELYHIHCEGGHVVPLDRCTCNPEEVPGEEVWALTHEEALEIEKAPADFRWEAVQEIVTEGGWTPSVAYRIWKEAR